MTILIASLQAPMAAERIWPATPAMSGEQGKRTSQRGAAQRRVRARV